MCVRDVGDVFYKQLKCLPIPYILACSFFSLFPASHNVPSKAFWKVHSYGLYMAWVLFQCLKIKLRKHIIFYYRSKVLYHNI